jgi:serine/threonine-protein kinase
MKLDIGLDIAGEYVVEREIGEGEMALVYLVSHLSTGTPWALKVVKTNHESLKERLQQEAKVHIQLSHPNIASMLDIVEGDGFLGLVMEFIEGETLDVWLRTHRPSQAESLQIFKALLSAMEYAHQKNIIHRDLKPSNIIMQKQDDKWSPKILDFGIAKAISDTGNNLTQTGTTMGTPGYMAPEQIRDAKHVDQRADIFSLGALFYEILTGSPAFQGDNNFDLINAVVSEPHRPILFFFDDCPENIIQLIDLSLSKDPNQRIASCSAMKELLEATPSLVIETKAPTLEPEFSAFMISPNAEKPPEQNSPTKDFSSEIKHSQGKSPLIGIVLVIVVCVGYLLLN